MSQAIANIRCQIGIPLVCRVHIDPWLHIILHGHRQQQRELQNPFQHAKSFHVLVQLATTVLVTTFLESKKLRVHMHHQMPSPDQECSSLLIRIISKRLLFDLSARTKLAWMSLKGPINIPSIRCQVRKYHL
jgi:hypothetical protein